MAAKFTRQLKVSPDVQRGHHYLAGWVVALIATLLLFSLSVPGSPAAELKPSAQEAFDRYVRATDARNNAELAKGSGLLWIDSLPDAARAKAYADLQHGAVKVQRLETHDNGAAITCPSAMIHHWVGVIFIPGVALKDVLGVLQDYNHHAEYYAPDVERAKIEAHDDDGHFRVFMRFRRHKIITVVLDTEQDVRYFPDSPSRAHSRSSAVRISQVENAGKNDEREKPPGNDDGFMWRMETWWRMVEQDGGVYVQSEVVSLTRDIPAGLGWMIGPFVTSIPKESLDFTLEATRRASLIKRSSESRLPPPASSDALLSTPTPGL